MGWARPVSPPHVVLPPLPLSSTAPRPLPVLLRAGRPWGPRLPARARVAIPLCPSAPRGSGRGAPSLANSHWAFLSPGSSGLDLVPPGKAVSCAQRSGEWACFTRGPRADQTLMRGWAPSALSPAPCTAMGSDTCVSVPHVCSVICFFILRMCQF